MKLFFCSIAFFVFISVNISAQISLSPFPEKQLHDEALVRGRNYVEKLTEFPAAKTQLAVSDSLIQVIVSAINPDSVKKFISGLQNFGTRYALVSNRDQIALWIKQQYLNMGFTDVVIDSFFIYGTWQKNVIATLPGKNTNEVCIIGGHYDSIIHTSPTTPAPGADDNASGTTMPLEIARVMKQKKYLPECTIKFLAFGAEELGLLGSIDYASKCSAQNMNIKLMINADMISYTSGPLSSSKVSINYYTGCESWMTLAKEMVSKYTVITPVTGGANSAGSDSHSFWKRGYQAVYFEEDQFSPYYHTSADTIGNYNMQYCAEIIKGACALLINTCARPGMIQNLSLYDIGDGSSLKTKWVKTATYDFNSYKVYIGSEPQHYDTSFTTNDTSLIIKGFKEGKPIYIAVSILTNSGIEGIASEKSITLYSKPMAPTSISLSSSKTQITITWSNAASALDFAGYYIYRADSAKGVFTKQNSVVVTGLTFEDKKAVAGRDHHYYVCSVDSSGNESANSNIVNGRLLTMDQGIGLIVTGVNGDGSIGNPSTQQVVNYYKSMLINYKYQHQDVTLSKVVTFANMGSFSSIIWANNSASENPLLLSSVNEIAKYLKAGGNLLLSTYFPTSAFSTASGYIKTFNPGDFIFDYFKIASSKYQLNTKFSGAKTVSEEYLNISVDSAKASTDYQKQLPGIEVINPTAAGKIIYAYDSFTGTNPLKDYPVGIEYLGSDYKTVLVSFPLYYMSENQVKDFIKRVIQNKFSEPLSVKECIENCSAPLQYELMQNYPNPFNPETSIEYSLSNAGNVKLKVYDVLGREITTLFNGEQQAGKHSVSFNGRGLSSGVYYYKLQSGSFVQTRKMMLVK